MSDATSTPVQSPFAPVIAIYCRQIAETRRHGKDGTVVICHNPPIAKYILDYEDGNDCIDVWTGESYAGAIEAAREWISAGAALQDRTSEIRGRA